MESFAKLWRPFAQSNFSYIRHRHTHTLAAEIPIMISFEVKTSGYCIKMINRILIMCKGT